MSIKKTTPKKNFSTRLTSNKKLFYKIFILVFISVLLSGLTPLIIQSVSENPFNVNLNIIILSVTISLLTSIILQILLQQNNNTLFLHQFQHDTLDQCLDTFFLFFRNIIS